MGDFGYFQRIKLFAKTVKNLGIAAFQAHNTFALPNGGDDDIANLVLRPVVTPRGFANIDALSVAARKVEDFGIN